MIFADFTRALGQLSDPRFRRVLWRGIALTVALLIGVTALFALGVGWLMPASITVWGIGEVDWLNEVFSVAAVVAMIYLSSFLMVPVASAFTGFFLDDVAAAVDDRYYPGLPPALQIGLYDTIRDSINFFGVLVAVNIVALALSFFVGPFAPVLFWVVNGYLLGREYFQMVAMRRLGRAGASALRRKHAGEIWLAGTLMAIPLSVPLLNLLIPVLGVATFTHLYYRLAPSSAG
ncbi:EI24 domain-containing protein [Actibacterium sp. D379-3]